MQAIRSRDTKPELTLRRILHARGLRYFVDRRALPTIRWKADIVFPRRQVAVFVDGCYWHGCTEHAAIPRTNNAYWGPKIARNRERDRLFDEALIAAGWTVVRIWEHDDPTIVADRIERLVRPS